LIWFVYQRPTAVDAESVVAPTPNRIAMSFVLKEEQNMYPMANALGFGALAAAAAPAMAVVAISAAMRAVSAFFMPGFPFVKCRPYRFCCPGTIGVPLIGWVANVSMPPPG